MPATLCNAGIYLVMAVAILPNAMVASGYAVTTPAGRISSARPNGGHQPGQRVDHGGERGMFAMLEFYFDDSGTHKGSRVAVWGGIAGYKEFLEELEIAWKAQLSHPCDGRPPIKAFHSSHLAASDGEFKSYSEAERDLTRYNFRKIIVEAG